MPPGLLQQEDCCCSYQNNVTVGVETLSCVWRVRLGPAALGWVLAPQRPGAEAFHRGMLSLLPQAMCSRSSKRAMPCSLRKG